ncbi:MAG: mannosyltransferase [Flavobacteriaceae bacterium]|nr:mannosyltransferase [Flavobacteriaceae bacterium]
MNNKKNIIKVLNAILLIGCFFGYYFMGYEIDRNQSLTLILIYVFLFLSSFFIIHKSLRLKKILELGILFRLIFFVSTPLLSDDFFRFIWDGMLLSNGMSPYEFTPNILNQSPVIISEFSQKLHEGMGSLSAKHYSNYPPVNQFGFFLANTIGGNSILVNIICIRILLILADLGVFWIGIKLLDFLKLDKKRIAYYFLNPLIIIELTGNLHWEGVMVFFFFMGLYLIFSHRKLMLGAVSMAVSVATKLIPLLILPVLWNYLKPKKSMLFGLYCLVFLGVVFIPFFFVENNITNYLKTLKLWFNRFEFNGSIYYIIREIGYEIKGYNIIRKLAKITPYVVLAIVAVFSFFRSNKTAVSVINGMLLTLSCYFFISTTVHPWYIVTLVSLALFTNYTYPLFWSCLIVLSYAAYGNTNFEENFYLIGLQYGIVYGVLLYELRTTKKIISSF